MICIICRTSKFYYMFNSVLKNIKICIKKTSKKEKKEDKNKNLNLEIGNINKIEGHNQMHPKFRSFMNISTNETHES